MLPLTVIDQIRLWEMERNRLKTYPGNINKDSNKRKYIEKLNLKIYVLIYIYIV